VHDDPRRMVRLLNRLDAPIEPGTEIILEVHCPSSDGVVTVPRALPGISLIRPVALSAVELRVQPVAARPTPPSRLFRAAQVSRDKVEEGDGIAFLLRMCCVCWVECAQRAVTGQYVALQVEAACRGGQSGKPMIPALALQRGAKGVEQEWKRRLQSRGMVAENVPMTNHPQLALERRVASWTTLLEN